MHCRHFWHHRTSLKTIRKDQKLASMTSQKAKKDEKKDGKG